MIIIDNPPVNAMGIATRTGLVRAVRRLNGDPTIRALVLCCAGRTFIAGADIGEFGKPQASPTMQAAIAAIEASPKPIIAAIHGSALGGGLEVALACHFRIASPSARVGFPEIRLGLFAGGGGTQFLSRIAGPENALKIALSGNPLSAEQALEFGIIDQISPGIPAEFGTAFARRIINEQIPVRPLRFRDDMLAPTRADPSGFEALALKMTAGSSGQKAHQANVDSIRRSFTLSFDQAMAIDSAACMELLAGSESRDLVRAFMEGRQAAKSEQ